MKNKILSCAVLATALLLTGCIGSNRAFRGVHSWNSRATDSKWGNEVIHAVMWIIPVYEVCLAGDIILFNSIEFWGGNNPINEPDVPKLQVK